MSIFDVATSYLPRFLRDRKVLDRLKQLDEEYERGERTGPLTIEANYLQGAPKTVKVKHDEKMDVR